jgi:damage-control phosphatase, subfamily I
MMISDYRCFFCFARAFEKLLEEEKLTVAEKNSFTRGMAMLYSKTQENFSAPCFSRELHQILKLYSNNPDPYIEVKKQSNDLVLEMYPALKKLLLESENPFETALRLAIAGNIIDFAVGDHYNLEATIQKVLKSGFAIDHSSELRSVLSEAKSVLYLGDNAGEIVFDKLLIETIMHPNLTYVVRGAPVINDATMDDAIYVGMDSVADVISSGYDAPSTILEKCSEEFQQLFLKADVIISKGQGNLEGLLDKTKKEIFFLLMVKCDVIAEALHVKKGDFVVKRQA